MSNKMSNKLSFVHIKFNEWDPMDGHIWLQVSEQICRQAEAPALGGIYDSIGEQIGRQVHDLIIHEMAMQPQGDPNGNPPRL